MGQDWWKKDCRECKEQGYSLEPAQKAQVECRGHCRATMTMVFGETTLKVQDCRVGCKTGGCSLVRKGMVQKGWGCMEGRKMETQVWEMILKEWGCRVEMKELKEMTLRVV
jgi:hypothetical protein